jgi:hypothetical protein
MPWSMTTVDLANNLCCIICEVETSTAARLYAHVWLQSLACKPVAIMAHASLYSGCACAAFSWAARSSAFFFLRCIFMCTRPCC